MRKNKLRRNARKAQRREVDRLCTSLMHRKDYGERTTYGNVLRTLTLVARNIEAGKDNTPSVQILDACRDQLRTAGHHRQCQNGSLIAAQNLCSKLTHLVNLC
jgi:hypothetical protein